MKEQLISKNTSKHAAELGFDEKHADFYIDKKENGDYTDLPCVPQSLLQKWLRETHNIQMTIKPIYDKKESPHISFTCDVIDMNHSHKTIKSKRFTTYEDALEEGLINGLLLAEAVLLTKNI